MAEEEPIEQTQRPQRQHRPPPHLEGFEIGFHNRATSTERTHEMEEEHEEDEEEEEYTQEDEEPDDTPDDTQHLRSSSGPQLTNAVVARSSEGDLEPNQAEVSFFFNIAELIFSQFSPKS